MAANRQGLAALILGFALSLGFRAISEAPPCPAGDCPLAAPGGAQALGSEATKLKVTWQPVAEAFAYRVELAANPYFAGNRTLQTVRRETVAAGPVVFRNLNPGTTFYLRVAALDREYRQQSPWSGVHTHATKGAMTISVGTYNVNNPDDTWPERGPWVADGIVSQQVAVLGVQEVYQEKDRRSLMEFVNAQSRQINGKPVYAMAPAVESDRGYDNRIVFDQRVVQVLASGGKPYDYQVGGDEVDRWLAWAALRHRASGWPILFVTTHLAPGDNKADLLQWTELVQRVTELKRAHNARWVVVAGDFNTSKFEPPADVMLPRMVQEGYGDVLGQTYRSYDTRGARAQVRENTWLNSFNDYRVDIDDYDVDKDDNGNSVDWIFASNDLQVPYYRVHAQYDDDELEEPIPSDHFLIWATLAYEPALPVQPVIRVDASVAPRSAAPAR